MTFNDIFKSSFLDNVSAVSVLDMILTILIAFGIGLFIFYVYKKTYSGVMYSFSFGVTLIALASFVSLRAEAVRNQLNGDNTTVETNGLNLSDMGSMAGTGGGGFGPGDRDRNSPDMNGFGGMPPSGDFRDMPQFGGMPQSGNETQSEDIPQFGNSFQPGNFGGPAGGNNSDKGSRDIPVGFNPDSGSKIGNGVWVGISVVVLNIGIIIAKKKKY